MEGLWTLFCGRSDHSSIGTSEPCAANLVLVTQPSSCVNHATIIFVDILILAAILSNIIWKIFSKKKFETPARYGRFSTSQIASAVFNGCLGLVYIGLGIWILEGKRRKDHSASPVHSWLLYLFQGFTWLSLGLTSLKGEYFLRAWLRILSIFTFFAAGIICFLAFSAAIIDHQTTVKEALDILSFLGASLLLLSMYGYKVAGNGVAGSGSTLYTPLIGEANSSCKNDSASRASAYAKAGLFSRLTFWWLNSLMKLGKQKILEEEEIPKLQDIDRAEFCYLQYMKHLSKQQLNERSSQPSLFWTIVACHWNDILLSGFFALLKTLAMSVGPLLLKAFIRVAEGKQAFKYEGYLLAFALFFSKNIESLSHRQWLFRSKLIGLKVKSLLTAAIYRKQLRLSNAAKVTHSAGEIMNYVTVDAYRIGEFPIWSHQTWTTCLQLCIALLILVHSVGQATIATLVVIVITVLFNIPLTKLQHKYQSKYRVAQGARLKTCSEAFVSMKVLKLYAWENHFKGVIEGLRKEEINWLSALQIQKTCSGLLFALSPVLISAATFGACYFLKVPLHASNVFTFLATVRLVQEPVRSIPEVISVVIQARVALTRIVNFLDASELQTDNVKKQICKDSSNHAKHAILMRSANLSWDMNPSKLTLKNINLDVQPGEKVAICGEVGSGKSTLLAAILGEVPCMEGTVEVYGKIAYVSQTAWIQTGTIRDNVLFGSSMDEQRYQDTLRRCSLMKDLELLPFGDMTEIGERGINLSGGQKQRIQLARALYQDADIYLLDDPFSAVDAHTASSLISEYVMEALCRKTVLLVTHQVDFLPAFHCCMLMSGGQILQSGSYHDLLASSREFLDLVDAHKETVGKKFVPEVKASRRHNYHEEEIKITNVEQYKASEGDQLIKREEREVGDTGFKPYLLYLNQNKGYWYLSIAVLCQFASVAVSTLQSTWIASSVDNPHISALKLILVYLILGGCYAFALLFRLLSTIILGMKASESLFTQLLSSLFRAPMHFYDSTPLGRIVSRVSSDLSIVDLDVPYNFMFTIAVATSLLNTIGVLTVISWQVLLVSVPVIYMAILLQRYYFAASKELMRINGTTKSFVASHLAETMAGAMIIRAFGAEEQFFAKNFDIIDRNASPFFHNFAANEWLIQRLETLSAIVLMTASLCLVMLPIGTFSSGLIGMMLSYGLTLNMIMVLSIQLQCGLANQIISVERLDQYMHVPEEPLEVIVGNRPPENWPSVGKVEICNLQIKYSPDTPLVLKGISCIFEGGDKIGIVGRTGSGKTTLLGALFRLMEPTGGKIVVDGIDICSIGLHDLRSRVGIIPQDPTLFNGSVRFNLDPLCRHNDEELWEVLGKCQLKETVREKEQGLDSFVMEDGSNWSMGQRQLFCLGRAMLRRSRVLVLDEATASIDNATDTVLQKTIRTEFAGCTVITVAHRIPTVMDCTKVLAISDGKLVEFDEPTVLMKKEDSLFGQLVKEYWSHFQYADHPH